MRRKGTQSKRLCRALGLVHISTGDVFRDAASKSTDYGKLVKAYLSKGNFMPDEIVSAFVRERLAEPDVIEHGCVLDGFPRSVRQAEALMRIVNIDRVIQLFEPPAVVVSASEKMSAVQQVALFRSFGVVISIHGSHLTGLLFAPPHIVAVEVQSVLSDLTFFKNGQCLVRRYVLSVGHTPQHPLTCDISRSRNVIEFERSKEGARSMRCRLKHKNANLVVNATILRRDLGLSCSMCRYRTGAA